MFCSYSQHPLTAQIPPYMSYPLPREKKSGIAGRKRRKKERDKDNAIPDENGTENDAGKVPENGSGNRTTAVAHGQRSGENATGHGNSDQEKKEGSSDDAAGRTDSTSIEDSEEKKRQEEFGRLTDLADGLLQAGQHDVYQQTKEELEEGAAAAAEAEAARSSAVGKGALICRCGLRGSSERRAGAGILPPRSSSSICRPKVVSPC